MVQFGAIRGDQVLLVQLILEMKYKETQLEKAIATKGNITSGDRYTCK